MAQTWSRVRARVVPKLKQIYRGNQSAYQPVEDIETTNNNSDVYTNNNYSCVNQNALDLPTPDSPSLARLQRWGRNLTGLHGLFTPQPRRYLAVPRTPTLSDRLDTFQAAAIYRASRQLPASNQVLRDSNNNGGTPAGGWSPASSPSDTGPPHWPPQQLVLPA